MTARTEKSGTRETAPPPMGRALYPTPRAVLFFASSIPAALFIVTIWRDVWYFSLYVPFAAVALMAADAVMALAGNRMEISLRVPRRLYVGQPGTVHVGLAMDNFARSMPVQALLEQTGTAEAAVPAVGLMEEGKLAFELSVAPKRRGQIAIEALWLRWRGPLKLVEARIRCPANEIIDVVPDVHGIHEAALQFFARDAVYGVKTQRFRGEGTEFETLCEYAQGMDTRFIDWKRSARHRKMLCKEFRQERNHQIMFGFDTGHLMLEPIDGMPKLDHAIKAGLLLGWISLHGGDLVGGCGFDARFRNFIKPGRGMPYFSRLQRFTASLAYRSEETNFTLGLAELNSRLQRRALVVLFTEFVDAIAAELLIESLQLMARRHVVVFVTLRDPMLARMRGASPDAFRSVAESVIADDFLRERSIVLERVARLGVHCLDVPAGALSAALLNRYLLIKQRGLL